MTTLQSVFIVAQTPPDEAYFSAFGGWLREHGNHDRGCGERSVSAYLSDLTQFARWFGVTTGQDFAPELITSTDLRGWYHHAAQVERVSPATWNRRRVSLSLFCQWALAVGLIAYSPFQGVPRMVETEQAPRGLGKTEAARFWRTVEQAVNTARSASKRHLALRNRAMIALMMYAGLREGEVAALDAADVTLGDKSGRVFVRESKGHKSGTVPLGREARIALAAWTAVHPQPGSLFDGITTRQIQRVVEEISADCGLEVSPHELRHTFAYRFRESSSDVVKLQTLMRHARIDTTVKYGKPRLEDLQAAVENL